MIEKWESLPEWARWVLIIPVLTIISLLIPLFIGFLVALLPDLEYSFFFLGYYILDLFYPMFVAVLYIGALIILIPRGKIITAYILIFSRVIFGIIFLAFGAYTSIKFGAFDAYRELISDWDCSHWLYSGGLHFKQINLTFYGDILRELFVFIGSLKTVGFLREEQL